MNPVLSYLAKRRLNLVDLAVVVIACAMPAVWGILFFVVGMIFSTRLEMHVEDEEGGDE